MTGTPGRPGQRLTLADGRRLGYDDHGPRDGAPIFYFHGAPSSRLDLRMFAGDGLAERLGVRVVAVDRPGCGLSDFQRRRRQRHWPADVAALADALGIDRFEVLGWSGGGPYALACAAHIPRRITMATLVSSMGPHDVPGLAAGTNKQSMRFFGLNRDLPVVGRMFDRLMICAATRHPTAFLERTVEALPEVDRNAMNAPAVSGAYLDAVTESFRHGTRGPQADIALMVTKWDFDPGRIEVPVRVWHGEQDADAPPGMGRWIAEHVPECEARFLADEGHISLIVNHAEAILRRR